VLILKATLLALCAIFLFLTYITETIKRKIIFVAAQAHVWTVYENNANEYTKINQQENRRAEYTI